jgi:cytochrome c oxidase assembly protein Cox11
MLTAIEAAALWYRMQCFCMTERKVKSKVKLSP